MKKTDIAMIILIASLSMFVAYLVAQTIPFFKAVEEPVKVKTIDLITTDVAEPDANVFKAGNINPSYEIRIEGETPEGQG